ncbi:MAG: transcriptional regulator [Sphaerochaetaceae bacterium]|nr:transcriptional regulator [Sphaerochaetaceae bacterium]MDC7246906.1 transcriptional regulator [Sphaerochaetaceae bacterium]
MKNTGSYPLYLHGKLLISIVQKNVGHALVAATKEAGAKGGTIIMARGIADNSILHALGIGDSFKDVVLTLVKNEEIEPVIQALHAFRKHKRISSGIAMLIDVPDILSRAKNSKMSGSDENDRRRKTMNSDHTLITCIVNKGYADEVMDAARAQGAAGGTIINASGTGKEEDVKFFGVQLVPEKEILLILVDSSKTGQILQAIKLVPCLSTPGSGIAYCTDVEQFITLGTPKEE